MLFQCYFFSLSRSRLRTLVILYNAAVNAGVVFSILFALILFILPSEALPYEGTIYDRLFLFLLTLQPSHVRYHLIRHTPFLSLIFFSGVF